MDRGAGDGGVARAKAGVPDAEAGVEDARAGAKAGVADAKGGVADAQGDGADAKAGVAEGKAGVADAKAGVRTRGLKRARAVEASAPAPAPAAAVAPARAGRECPYMHTINRGVLDFDFERVCSVSLSAHNVYACLVCGRYYQGRAPASHAFQHAVGAGHRLFLHLGTERAYCLPDGYEVEDPVVRAISFALRPRFSRADVAALDAAPRPYATLGGGAHLQGVTALDGPPGQAYAVVVLQVLLCVAPLRDWLLLADGGGKGRRPRERLVRNLAELARKVWSPAAFRAHVSPQAVLRAVGEAGGRVGQGGDPVAFFAWLVHCVGREVARGKRGGGLVRECFEGRVEVTTSSDVGAVERGGGVQVKSVQEGAFLYLSLDLPPKPLFKDASERTLVEQVQLWDLLQKYDGASQHHVVQTGGRKSYRLVRLPPYLVLTVVRMTKTKFMVEKNSAVVHCPVTGLDMAPLCAGAGDAAVYHLIAVVIHDGPHDTGEYRVAFRHRPSGAWFNIQGISVTEVLPQVVSLSETCMLLYERADKAPALVSAT